jgi:hypothetical protein
MGIFKLHKGWHYSQGGETHDLQNQKLEFRFKFDNSIIYKSKTWEDQYDLHKLTGFSSCNVFHHTQSARFTWRWIPNWMGIKDLQKNWDTVSPTLDINDGVLEIFGYIYVDGVRIWEKIANCPINTWMNASLQRKPNFIKPEVKGKYIFKLIEENAPKGTRPEKLIMDSSNCSDMGGYMLWPYFGGNETAPHEITIEMEYKK